MYERVVEIIMFLVNELKSSKQLSEVDVAVLSNNGYTASEISTAFSWLFERMNVGQAMVEQSEANPASHRILHDVEKMVISPEAYGYLLQAQQFKILTNSDIETIIERIMAAGFSTVGIPEMKSFIAGMLFDTDSQQGSGGRISWGSNDSVH
ncbi:MAG: DUF494 family protein [Ignavibacteriales bacterium]|nr:DUF494 family protein [Ignavibacteriales bacterium]